MFNPFVWLLEAVPGWAWAIIAAAGLFGAWRVLGNRGALALLAFIFMAGIYRHGRNTGRADQQAETDEANEKAVKDYDRIKAETDRMSDADLDAANAPWVRKQPSKR